MSTPLSLSGEFRRIVESQMTQVLVGIESTFTQIIENQKVTPTELKNEIERLQDTFNLLFQKWSLEILYTLMLKSTTGFGEIKKLLGVNSRTLSDKLKMLQTHHYITRNIIPGPPLHVKYALTTKGKNTVLLALPLIYYTNST